LPIGNLLSQVLTLFIIMVVGVIARKTGIITREYGRKMSELLIYITAPAMIIVSMNFKFSGEMLSNAGLVLIIAFAVHFFSIALGFILYARFEPDTKKIAIFATVFSNCQFLGFPIMNSIFGKEGEFYASIYLVAFTLLIWTVGVMLLTGKRDLRSAVKVLVNPAMIAIFIGMILFLFSVTIPVPIYNALNFVGSMTVPLAMLFIGSQLAEIKLSDILSGFKVYLVAFARLLIIPLALLGVLRLIGVSGVAATSAIVLAGMPTAANSAIFAEMFTGEAAFASRVVAITTLFCIATVPIVFMASSL
jgi:predicted permease